jgi:S1-C subfamily serine protease
MSSRRRPCYRARTPVNSLDLLILVLVLALAAIGYAQGFIVGAASLAGLVLGGVVGTRVVHAMMERVTTSPEMIVWAPLIGLIVGLVITLAGAMAMQDIGARLRGRVDGAGPTSALDHLLGAVLLAGMGLVLAWFAAAVSIGMPQLRELRPKIVDSRVVTTLNAALPDAGPLIGAIAAYDPFPRFDGGAIDTPAPDARLPSDPAVRAASRSVVRVVGRACGYRVTGTGWVAAPGYVVTNAHVVAGHEQTQVEPTATARELRAYVVAFDSRNDVAVLRVEGLGLPPLPIVAEPAEGTAGVLLGYPESRGFTSTAARYSDRRQVKGQDIYGRGDFVRDVTSFRGTVRHGNSGGPLVDGNGHVLTTVFAATVGEQVEGGYGIPNQVAGQALDRAREVPQGRAVVTGPCVS